MDHGNLRELIALDVDSSDNLTEEMLHKFLMVYGPQLQGTYSLYFVGEYEVNSSA
jgi:hypothetical protein